jgi:hypothetical protein
MSRLHGELYKTSGAELIRGAPEAEQAEKLELLSINTIRTLAMDAVLVLRLKLSMR